MVIEVTELLVITDYFMICSGSNDRQVKAIYDNIRAKLAKKGVKPIGVEGEDRAQWILMDYGDLVVHIFTEEQREYSQLDRLWRDAPIFEWDKKRKVSESQN